MNREEWARLRQAGLSEKWVAFVAHCREIGFGSLHEVKLKDGEPILVREDTPSSFADKAVKTWKPGDRNHGK